MNEPLPLLQSSDPEGNRLRQTVRRFAKLVFTLSILGTASVGVAGGVIYWYFSATLPRIITVEDYKPLTVTRVVSGTGKDERLMGEFYKERRYLVPYEKMPVQLVQAFISAEDDKFFEHQGINPASILRATIVNFKAGHVVQGGSTITQQVAKSLLLTPERSFVRKFKEVILAGRIEANLSKEQILYLYLNQIYLGHGAYGVESAARTYFGKPVEELTLGECALLAGLPQAPGKYSPHLNPKRAKERQLYVIRRMNENKFITQTQMQESSSAPLRIQADVDVNARYSAHLIELVRRFLIEKYGEKAVYEEGLKVTLPTTPEHALAARNALRDGLRSVDKRVGYRGPIKRLKGEEAIAAFLQEQRTKIVLEKTGFEVLTSDGRLDGAAAMKVAGIASESLLLDEGKLYQGVVTSLDDRAKIAGVLVGAARADLPLEGFKWARGTRDEGTGLATRGEPSAPSQVFAKGDVIWVRPVKVSASGATLALEQEPQVEGAIFSLDVQSGQVLALEGGYDFSRSEFNRVMQAQRQPGSAFKPLIYAAGLEKGFTPASVVVDAPIVYEDAENGKWKPTNFEEKFYGDTTFRQALIKSRNVPTIKIVQSVQVPYVIDFARRFGLTGQLPSDLSLSLGSGAISLYEMTRAYSVFPRLGRQVNPVFLMRVEDREARVLEEGRTPQFKGRPLATNSPQTAPVAQEAGAETKRYPLEDDPEQLMDPRQAYVMTHLMKEVVAFGTGHEAKTLGRAAAGKTGTTNDYQDAWFMGFTPSVVTGVWVGFDSQRTIGPGETGARAALPIWLSFMKEVVKSYPDQDFQVPPGVVFASIDPTTGHLASPNLAGSIKEAFVEGTEPQSGPGVGQTPAQSQSEFLKEDME
jgi:penicillin-binding protein 1A